MRRLLFCGSILGLLIVGCDQKKDTATTGSAPAKVETSSVPAAPAGPTTMPAAPTTLPSVTVTPPTVSTPVSTPPAQVPAPADVQAAATTNPAVADAQSKLEQVMQAIKDKKFDAADKLVAELEAKKSSLPQSLQTQLADAEAALKSSKLVNGAKDALNGVNLPSLNK